MSYTLEIQNGFRISERNGSFLVTYGQEKYQSRHLWPIFFLLILAAIGLAFSINVRTEFLRILISILFLVFSFQLVKYFLNRRRNEKSFTIDDNGFEIQGEKYKLEKLKGLSITRSGPVTVAEIHVQISANHEIAFSSDAGAASPVPEAIVTTTRSIRAAMLRKLNGNTASINYNVTLLSSEGAVILASGLSDDTAVLLMEKTLMLIVATVRNLNEKTSMAMLQNKQLEL